MHTMIDVPFIILPGIIILGIVASLSDIREGKVKNEFILFALAYALLANILMLSHGSSDKYALLQSAIEIFSNIFFAAGLGFFLYHLGFWAPGDGKLFLAFSALIPLQAYETPQIPFIPSIIFLSNALVLAALVILITSCLQARKIEWEKLREIAMPQKIISHILLTALSIFSFSWIIRIMLQPLPAGSMYHAILSYSLSLAAAGVLEKKMKRKRIRYGIYAALSASYFLLYGITAAVAPILLFSVIFSVSKNIVLRGYELSNKKKITIEELRPYHRLAEPVMKGTVKLYRGGRMLNAQEVAELRQVLPAGKKVAIQENMRLAPFLFLAALITLAIRGEIITWVTAHVV